MKQQIPATKPQPASNPSGSAANVAEPDPDKLINEAVKAAQDKDHGHAVLFLRLTEKTFFCQSGVRNTDRILCFDPNGTTLFLEDEGFARIRRDIREVLAKRYREAASLVGERLDEMEKAKEQKSPRYAALKKQYKLLDDAASYVLTNAGTARTLNCVKDYIRVKRDAFDQKHYLLATKTGQVVDFQHNGKLRPGRPEDMLTLCAGTELPEVPETQLQEYGIDPATPAAFRYLEVRNDWLMSRLTEICNDSEELLWFILRYFGYFLLGKGNQIKKVLVLVSPPDTGKSALVNLISKVLDKLKITVDPSFIAESPFQQNSESATPVTATIEGRRLIITSEANHIFRLASGKVKRLSSGGDLFSVRELYRAPREIEPRAGLVIVSNYAPIIAADDEALLKRLWLVHFKNRFVENPDPHNPHERPLIRDFVDKLEKLLPEVLALLIYAGLEVQQDPSKLAPPAEVVAAGKEYQESQDLVLCWLNSRCERVKGAVLLLRDAYSDYQEWFSSEISSTAKILGRNKFGQQLARHLPRDQTKRTGVFLGACLLPKEY